MIRRPPRSTLSSSSAASDVYKRQDGDETLQLMDMLLAKKRAGDRREWLEEKGNLAII
ncbi:hypothetical protein KAM475_41820 [Aeromonas caviae]|nr:hypothetical protein KAM475_41820 [Aeromonas caviae]